MVAIKHAEAARHICEEARVVLSSLRGGHADVAYGELAQNLQTLRTRVRTQFLDSALSSTLTASPHETPSMSATLQVSSSRNEVNIKSSTSENVTEQMSSKIQEIDTPSQSQQNISKNQRRDKRKKPIDVGCFARPFLDVVTDPGAAGPHTLVALRALHRLLQRKSLVPTSKSNATNANEDPFTVALNPLVLGVLQCKFEQTDAGADEAVEMAIADLLLVAIDADARPITNGQNPNNYSGQITSKTFMSAFHTVFVTRNTFVHSPALCYHFEDVLEGMVVAAFLYRVPIVNHDDLIHSSSMQQGQQDDAPEFSAAYLILDFLVQQLLHCSPLLLSSYASTTNASSSNASKNSRSLNIGSEEAQAVYDATRLICLRLSRCCLRTGWGSHDMNNDSTVSFNDAQILRLIQDELCLSLLVIGQSFWTHDGIAARNTNVASLEVLSEVCATISTLWSITTLRCHLEAQFEAIFSGIFQRALSLLRKRSVPTNSDDYMDNIIFDTEIEIVLEALVDILNLHDRTEEYNFSNNNDGKKIMNIGALETLFLMYDCNLTRSDVAMGLIIELSKCCGGHVEMDDDNISLMQSQSGLQTLLHEESTNSIIETETPPLRTVPARLKELSGEALMGNLQCFFGEYLYQERQATEDLLSETLESSQTFSKGKVLLKKLRRTKDLKRIMHRGAKLFNKKHKEGIQFLMNESVLPTPIKPKDLAEFLRLGIVLGLDKVAVGAYLGEAGKAPVAGNSPHDYERDWFHKETLKAYCSLFNFENQSLLDGLRMFLSSFRLPGEAQQIDRILQAFAESCGMKCEEGRELGLFSEDPKKAADAAYLLAFSLIMLNTDLHNENIRPERKMSKEDFVKNNTNYGRDITDEGKDFPREVLERLYDNIQEVELRTEGEGADGIMTFERWKDVLSSEGRELSLFLNQSNNEEITRMELKDLLVESLWRPLLGSISGFWGVNYQTDSMTFTSLGMEQNQVSSGSEMLGFQGSRLGIDIATKLLNGLRGMGRKDIFRQVFVTICNFSGLLHYPHGIAGRIAAFSTSVERQGAVVLAINTAKEAGDDIGVAGWKCVLGILFELRDLKLLSSNRQRGIVFETDHDLLSSNLRNTWQRELLQQQLVGKVNDMQYKTSSMSSMMGTMSRIIFGDDDDEIADSQDNSVASLTIHEKEKLFFWDDVGAKSEELMNDDDLRNLEKNNANLSPGEVYENLLILESSKSMEEHTSIDSLSRIRNRLSNACDFNGLISGSRFQTLEGIHDLLVSLVDLIRKNTSYAYGIKNSPEIDFNFTGEGERNDDNITNIESGNEQMILLSPASEAFAEILICEISIKNRDRIQPIWDKVLRNHYIERLGKVKETVNEREEDIIKALSYPGIEKCVTGLLRLSCWMMNRKEIANDILYSLRLLHPPDGTKTFVFDRMSNHLSEGMWRICCDIDSLQHIQNEGWSGLLGLLKWCASKGGSVVLSGARRGGLAEDDPSFQAFRAINLMLHAEELKNCVPFSIVSCIIALVENGERGYCAKLMIAGLDLLNVMHSRLEPFIAVSKKDDQIWLSCWLQILIGISEAAKYSKFLVRLLLPMHRYSLLLESELKTYLIRSIFPLF